MLRRFAQGEALLLTIAVTKVDCYRLQTLVVFHTGRQKLGYAPRYYLLVQDIAFARVSCAPCCSTLQLPIIGESGPTARLITTN